MKEFNEKEEAKTAARLPYYRGENRDMILVMGFTDIIHCRSVLYSDAKTVQVQAMSHRALGSPRGENVSRHVSKTLF